MSDWLSIRTFERCWLRANDGTYVMLDGGVDTSLDPKRAPYVFVGNDGLFLARTGLLNLLEVRRLNLLWCLILDRAVTDEKAAREMV